MSFLDDLREILDREQDLTSARICALLADRFGGERVYIPRKFQETSVTSDDTPRKVMDREGVSRATAYRKIRGNWVSNWR